MGVKGIFQGLFCEWGFNKVYLHFDYLFLSGIVSQISKALGLEILITPVYVSLFLFFLSRVFESTIMKLHTNSLKQILHLV